MKKLENFTNSLSILAEADFKLAESNDIYRTGIIGQFNLTFELAWKALQEIMRIDRKSTRLNSSHRCTSRMPSSA